MAITEDGELYAWGGYEGGSLGIGKIPLTYVKATLPTKLEFTKALSYESELFEFKEELELLTPTKEGYIFDGWYLDSELKEKFDETTMPVRNITLYGRWIEE